MPEIESSRSASFFAGGHMATLGQATSCRWHRNKARDEAWVTLGRGAMNWAVDQNRFGPRLLGCCWCGLLGRTWVLGRVGIGPRLSICRGETRCRFSGYGLLGFSLRVLGHCRLGWLETRVLGLGSIWVRLISNRSFLLHSIPCAILWRHFPLLCSSFPIVISVLFLPFFCLPFFHSQSFMA